MGACRCGRTRSGRSAPRSLRSPKPSLTWEAQSKQTGASPELAALEVERPDAALLDAGLADGNLAPVAAVLTAGGVPFAFLTGYEDANLGVTLSNLPVLARPFGSDALEGVVLQL